MSEQNVEEGSVSNSALASNEQTNGVITVVLTADNHLGYAAPSQSPRKREEYRQRLRHAFQQATDFAIGQGVDLFVQAGDLFDTPRPDEQDRSFVGFSQRVTPGPASKLLRSGCSTCQMLWVGRRFRKVLKSCQPEQS